MRGAAARAIALAFLVLAPCAALRADVVHLKDGGKVEGKIVAEDAKSVTLDTNLGRMPITRDRIAKIEKGPTAKEELAEREKALGKEATADAWFELAEFAGSKGLKRERERLIDVALKRDPQHAGANRARGRVLHEGRWMTPAERDALVKQAEAAAMTARGLVEWQGRWITPQEKAHLERGEVLVGGKWLSGDDAKRAQGLEKVGDEWVAASEALGRTRVAAFAKEASLSLALGVGDHVVCASPFGKEHLARLQDASERAYAESVGVLREKQDDLAWIGGSKALAMVVDTREDFGLFCRFFARHEEKVDARWADGVARVDGFYWWDPTGTSATLRGARHADDTIAHTVHQLGHVLLNRHRYNFRFLPTWLDEGYAAWLEHRVLGRNAISCVSTHREYGGGEVRKEELLSRASWFDDAVAAVAAGKGPPFAPILTRDLTTIEPDEVAKAMVVVDWMVTEKADAFAKLLTTLRDAWPKGPLVALGPEARAAHDKAFAAFGVPWQHVDVELKRAIAARPPAPKAGKGEGE